MRPSCHINCHPLSSLRCSSTPASRVPGEQLAPQLSKFAIAGLISRLPVGALGISALGMGPFDSTTSAIEARLISPSASDFALSRSPLLVHADRPLEVELSAIGQGAFSDAGMAESVASWISAHALLQISAEIPGQPGGEVSLRVKARPSRGSWIVRALVRPAAWADAVSVTVVSLSLAGRPLTCDCLPATLRVGYNHAPAPEGAVFEAAKAGDVPALLAAIDAGGSTEEAAEVRGA